MITKKILRRDDDLRRRLKGSADADRGMREIGRRIRSGSGVRGQKAGLRGGLVTRTKYLSGGDHRRQFGEVISYLLEGKNGEFANGTGRVADTFGFNLLEDDEKALGCRELRESGRWMAATAATNTRLKKTAGLHYVISLPARDAERGRDKPEFWRSVAREALATLGMEEHQALFVVHRDTDNPHMHCLINRVHPTTARAQNPYRDLIQLEAMNRRLEERFNLTVERGRHIDPETGKTYDWKEVREGKITIPSRRKRRDRIDVEKKIQEVRKMLADTKPFSTAKSWDELDSELAGVGLTLRAKGRGLVVEMGDGSELKVSRIAGKAGGRELLEERFGEDFGAFLDRRDAGQASRAAREKVFQAELKRQSDMQAKKIEWLKEQPARDTAADYHELGLAIKGATNEELANWRQMTSEHLEDLKAVLEARATDPELREEKNQVERGLLALSREIEVRGLDGSLSAISDAGLRSRFSHGEHIIDRYEKTVTEGTPSPKVKEQYDDAFQTREALFREADRRGISLEPGEPLRKAGDGLRTLAANMMVPEKKDGGVRTTLGDLVKFCTGEARKPDSNFKPVQEILRGFTDQELLDLGEGARTDFTRLSREKMNARVASEKIGLRAVLKEFGKEAAHRGLALPGPQIQTKSKVRGPSLGF